LPHAGSLEYSAETTKPFTPYPLKDESEAEMSLSRTVVGGRLAEVLAVVSWKREWGKGERKEGG